MVAETGIEPAGVGAVIRVQAGAVAIVRCQDLLAEGEDQPPTDIVSQAHGSWVQRRQQPVGGAQPVRQDRVIDEAVDLGRHPGQPEAVGVLLIGFAEQVVLEVEIGRPAVVDLFGPGGR
eukprot:Anaeramoba_flamelloidesa1055394_20.p1 GENE.a1055394_20~~a1055394_20.p1  ORF type:complete len:119 (+),score=5.39 a1055394_20:226-582(+)